MASQLKEENQSVVTQVPLSTEDLSARGLNPIKRFSAFIKEAREVFRETGFRGLFRKYRWKLVAVFFLYYLIRDSFLYIFLPYLAWKGFW